MVIGPLGPIFTVLIFTAIIVVAVIVRFRREVRERVGRAIARRARHAGDGQTPRRRAS
jgi:hypothetical protein